MLFEGNARIAGRYFKTPLGKLKKNYAADVIITDYIPPTPVNEGNINSHILFGMNGRSVITTICAGRILMKDRQLSVCDEEEEMAKVREGAERLACRING